MKVNAALVTAIGAMIANAQSLKDLPNCGQICISNMFGKSNEFGCKPTEASCFCKDTNFMNGVRDCSLESCTADAEKVIQYAVNICAEAGVVIQGAPGSSGAGGPATGSASHTVTLEDHTAGGHGLVPIATSTYETVVEENGSSVTKTVESTIFSQPTGVASEEGSTSQTTRGKPSSSRSTSDRPTSTSDDGEDDPEATDESDDTGAAPKTGASVGLLAAAALAALLI